MESEYKLKEGLKICHYCHNWIEQNPLKICVNRTKYNFHKECFMTFREKMYLYLV